MSTRAPASPLRLSTNPRHRCLVAALVASLCAVPGAASEPGASGLRDKVMTRPGMTVSVTPLALADLPAERQPAALRSLRQSLASGEEPIVYLESRTGRPLLVEPGAVPWIPGSANSLLEADLADLREDGAAGPADLATLEAIARRFIAEHAALFGVGQEEIALDAATSGPREPILGSDGATVVGHRGWTLRFDWAPHGVPVEGAGITFKVKHGNLVQFGSRYVGEAKAVPAEALLDQDKAAAVLADHLGVAGFALSPTAEPRQRVYPTAPADGAESVSYLLTWTFELQDQDGGGWQGAVDAVSGELVFFRSTAVESCPSGQQQVRGGIRLYDTGVPSEGHQLFPFADVGVTSGGATVYADGSGCFTPGSAPASTLSGRYFRIQDVGCSNHCLRLEVDPGQNLDFGRLYDGSTDCNSTSTENFGTNCALYTDGGPGNTTSARTTYYHLNFARNFAFGRFPCPSPPGVCWQNGQITVETNHSTACNGSFQGGTLRFGVSVPSGSDSCRNYGEIPSAIYHEYGHFLDISADGNGATADRGSEEAYADMFQLLMTHDSCYGRFGARQGARACGVPYGYGCLGCDGSRELDFRNRTSGTNSPRTPAGNCSSCATASSNPGPCGKQAHCESHVASEAIWDLAAVDLPAADLSGSQAWSLAEDLFFSSAGDFGSLFTCSCAGGGSGSGAAMGTLYTTLRAADDCDGNTANGTPHAAAIFAALNRHGIAAGAVTDPQNQNNDCTGADVASSLAHPSNNVVTGTLTNSGPQTDPSAWLRVTFASTAEFSVTAQSSASACTRTITSQQGTDFSVRYDCPSTSLGSGSSVTYGWNLPSRGAGPDITIFATATGSLTDPVPANNQVQLTIPRP